MNLLLFLVQVMIEVTHMDEQSWPPITLIHFVEAGQHYSENNDCSFSSGPALYPAIRIQAKMPS